MLREKLTSRDRVLRALSHQEPDRVPFNLSLTVDIYHRLRAYLNLAPEDEKRTGVWTDVSPSLDLLEAMQVDIFYIGMSGPGEIKFKPPLDGLLYDEWGVGRAKIVREDGSFYYEMVKPPLAGATLQDIEAFPWPVVFLAESYPELPPDVVVPVVFVIAG